MEDEEFKKAILTVITHPSGTAVDLFGGQLSVARLENGRYSVAIDSDENKSEVIFVEAEAAVDEFLADRRNLQLGYDFEKTA